MPPPPQRARAVAAMRARNLVVRAAPRASLTPEHGEFPFLFCLCHRHDTPLTFLALASPRRVLGANATSVVISLPQRAVPRRTLPQRAAPRRSTRRATRLQRTATAARDDEHDPDTPELVERGYSSDDEHVHSSDEANEPPRTRQRCVVDNTPPGRIDTSVLNLFPPPKGGECVANDPEQSDVPAARSRDDAGAKTASHRRSTRSTQPESDDAAPLARAASAEERSGATGEAAAEVAAAEGAAVADDNNTISAAPARRRQFRAVACPFVFVCRCSPSAVCAFFAARVGVGRPRKQKGRGKGRPAKRFGVRWKKSGTQGAAKMVRRAAARIAEQKRTKSPAASPPEPVGECELRKAIAVILRRSYPDAVHQSGYVYIAEDVKKQHDTIAKDIAGQLQCDERTVADVMMKIAEDSPPEKRRPGAGRPGRIQPGTEAADRLLGGLLAGFGTRQTANLVNAVVNGGGVPVHKSLVLRTAKGAFGLVVGKRKICKTGSRDVLSNWAKARLAICMQFLDEIFTRKFDVNGTLFLDEHAEFCVLGQGGHHGNSGRYEWRAHRDEGESRLMCFAESSLRH